MKKWLDAWYNMYAVMALMAVVALGGYEWINWSEWSRSDWGTWAGAMGTVATLAMTILLATESERRRRREQLDLALIYATELDTRVERTRMAVREVQVYLLNNHGNATGATYTHCANKLRDAVFWNEDILKNLVVVPGRAAATLARVSGRNAWIADLCEETAREISCPNALRDAHKGFYDLMQSSINDMCEAQNLCRIFVGRERTSNQ